MDYQRTSTLRMVLGKNLKIQRFLRGWSQEHLAEAAGLHRTYISIIERGHCSVSIDNLAKLARALEVPLNSLLADPPLGLGTTATAPPPK